MSFKELYGQEGLRHTLTGKLIAGRVSHAVLLCGPPGSGKKSWGLALARALLCSRREGAAPCGECASCRQFQTGGPPALFYLRPQGRRLGIDQLRRIRGKFYLEGDNRVCLIEEAEKMTAEACASLLKILEEPPRGLYFILLTARPQQLPATILSRCQRFTLQPLSGAAIAGLLMEKEGLAPERAQLLSRLSKGLPGLALKLAGSEIFEEQREKAAGVISRMAEKNQPARELLSQAEELAAREDLPFLLELLYLTCRDGLLFLLCRNEALLVNPVEAGRWTGAVSPASLEEAMLLIQRTAQQVNTTNVNRRLAIEAMLLQLQRRFL